jgi:hypothetical protein
VQFKVWFELDPIHGGLLLTDADRGTVFGGSSPMGPTYTGSTGGLFGTVPRDPLG